jgi:FkbM family methyltransferase
MRTLAKRLRAFFQPDDFIQADAQGIFEIVYGRAPSEKESQHLNYLLGSSQTGNLVELFRRITSGFDHQTLTTPFEIRFGKRDVEFISIHGIDLAIDNADISVGQPLQQGEFEPHLVHFFSQRLKPGMTFVDIGANIGIYSILAARLVGETGKVICFEPNTENCRLILLSIHRNHFQNVTLHPVALADKMGHALFSTHIGSNGGLTFDSEQQLLIPNCVVVPTFRLEDLIEDKVDFIKMDVEGAEGMVVKGAGTLIDTYRPIVTSEFSMEMLPRVSGVTGKEFIQFFVDRQYLPFLVNRNTKELELIEDLNLFTDQYGPLTRIEDLAFFPNESSNRI